MNYDNPNHLQQGMCYMCKEILDMSKLKFQYIPERRVVAHVCTACQKEHNTMDVDKFVPDGDVTL